MTSAEVSKCPWMSIQFIDGDGKEGLFMFGIGQLKVKSVKLDWEQEIIRLQSRGFTGDASGVCSWDVGSTAHSYATSQGQRSSAGAVK